MYGLHGSYSLGFGLLLLFFGIGLVVRSIQMMQSGEGQYDEGSIIHSNLFNILGIVAGLAMIGYGGVLLFELVPMYIFF